MAAEPTEVLVGLDIGTTGVKAIAVAPGRQRRRRRRAGLPALDAARRLVGAGSGGLVARDAGGARRAPGAARAGARDRRDRPLGTDARPRRPRRRRPCRAAGDPLERPAHGGRVRRDRGAHRARAADRPHGQPGADGLHGAEAPLAAPPRAGVVRPDRTDHAAEGLRAAAADRRVGDRRRRRVRHAPARRRPPHLVGRGARRARAAGRVAAARARVARGHRDHDRL